MSTRRDGFRLEVSPGVLLLLAGMFYIDQGVGMLPWALAACATHELGHVAASMILKGKVRKMSLSAVGVELSFEYPRGLSYGEECLVTLAGPVANLITGAIAYGMGHFLPAILSFGIGGFNLLPILPLDGGRVMFNLLSSFFDPPRPEQILTVTAGVLTGVLVGFGVIVAVKYANVTLLLTASWLLIKILRK